MAVLAGRIRMKAHNTYAGLLLVTLTITMYEILLTRIFSAFFYHHLAFVAISTAMFGMTIGAIIVYVTPKFTADNALKSLSIATLIFAILTGASYGLYYVSQFPAALDLQLLVALMLTLPPFIVGGICVCIALTKLSNPISKLYAADLIGAALGCFILVPLMQVSDGPSTFWIAGGIAGLAALFFASALNSTSLKITAGATTVLLFALGIGCNMDARSPSHPFERWNCFSRILVNGDATPHMPQAWGLSSKWPTDKLASELNMYIDANALTVLTKFDGDKSKVEHLKYDVTNLGHVVRPDSRVLAIGVGGGRDILSALVFNQKSVEGVEINGNILKIIENNFGDFTGHLDHYPQVKLVNNEARSFVARTPEKFDIIQVSLIDTFAATASGAFAFTEHSLYTTDAWRHFLNHLTDRGIISFSRWYAPEHAEEAYRLTTLAVKSLQNAGIADTRQHIIMVAKKRGALGGRKEDGVVTMLVGKSAFTPDDIERVKKYAKQMDFEVLLSPTEGADKMLVTLASGTDIDRICASYPLDISPPTDDRPFYLFFLRLTNPTSWAQESAMTPVTSVVILKRLLITMSLLTIVCIFFPLLMRRTSVPWKKSFPFLTFFASIGFGFMFIEISQMQRLIIFLGHPVYGLSVVLFTLLLASGIGSYTTMKLKAADAADRKTASRRFLLLLGVLIVSGFATPWLTSAFETAATPVRVIETIVVLFPMGLCMGMAFPIGMSLAKELSEDLTPWLWGINGATSVYASVLVTAVSLTFGISAAYWWGVCFYLAAALSYVWAVNKMNAETL